MKTAAAGRGRPAKGMHTWIALFRGINVGGRNPLPMKALAALLEELGSRGVRTYIQSGNVVFASKRGGAAPLSKAIAKGIRARFGFEPGVLLMGSNELEDAIAGNPFPEAETDPKALHLGFLAAAPPSPDLEKLEALRSESERFQLAGKVFYLHAPDGVGRSRLAASAEKLLGVPMTDRNWRTVCKLREMVQAP